MKILVTGGTTFVSKYTAEYFANKKHEVYVLNRNSRKQPENTTLINCDRLDLGGTLKGVHFDLILDITAYTEEHINALLNSGVTFDDYIFISSSAVYPETNPQPFSEEQPCGRNSVWGDYGFNKLKAEECLLRNVPDAYILRPPYFYGVYENLYREAFVFDCAMENRKFYIPANGEMKLQFFNVKDLCCFIEILLCKRPKNNIFNVGNSDYITVKDWVTLCYKAAGKTPELVYVQNIVGNEPQCRSSVVTRQAVSEAVKQRDYFCFYDYEYLLDVSKQNALMPKTIPLELGLKEEFEWYKNNRDSIYNRKPYIEFIDNNLK